MDGNNVEDSIVAEKTIEQQDEIKDISGLSRILFHILAKCNWIPFTYKCLLAVVMTPGSKEENAHATTTTLNQEFWLDILLRQGSVTLKTHKNLDEMLTSTGDHLQSI
jgi:hypothetical protein